MSTTTLTPDYGNDPESNNQQFGRNFFRIWPYWPMILVILLIGIGGAYAYLRYATPLYEAKAKVAVIDNSQDNTNNIIQTIHVDTRGEQIEAEKQIDILQSKDLLSDVIQKLKLNVQWTYKKGIQTRHIMNNLPVELNYDSANMANVHVEGLVVPYPAQNKVEFRGISYPADKAITTNFGKIKWHINHNALANGGKLWLRIRTMNETAEELKKRLKVTPVSKQSSILDISVMDEIPERGVQILNSLIETYSASNMAYNKKNLSNTVAFLDERLKIVSDEVKNVENALQDYQSRAKITDLAKEGQNYLDQVKDNDQKLSEVNIQLGVLQQIEHYVSQRNQNTDPIPATLGLTDPILISLLNQLFQDEFELQKYKNLSGENNPMVKVTQQQIDQLKPSILQSVANLKRSLEASRTTLQSNNNNFDNSLKSIPGKERTLLDISRQRNIKNDMYTYLLQKREEKAIALSALTPNFRLIESPENNGLIKPKPWVIYTYGTLGALFLASLLVYRREFRSNRILYRSEIDSFADAPVIGEIVYQRTDRKAVVMGPDERSLIAEQFRELRTNISYVGNNANGGKVLLLTSFIPKEGKSFISTNLSISLAMTGKKVALLEFDLYDPKISAKLDMDQEPGITNFLNGEVSVEQIVKPSSLHSNLWVLPCGTMTNNPAELILNGKLPALMEYVKKEFDVIVIDSPCLGLTTDAKILADHANVTLYVLRQNYSRRNFLKFINQTYESGKLPNMNLIFNGIKIRKIPGMQNWDGYGYNSYKYRHKNLYTHKKIDSASKRLKAN